MREGGAGRGKEEEEMREGGAGRGREVEEGTAEELKTQIWEHE